MCNDHRGLGSSITSFSATFAIALRSLRLEVCSWRHKCIVANSRLKSSAQPSKSIASWGQDCSSRAYETCLAYELENLRLRIERQKPVPLIYEAVKLDCGFRADLVVEGRVVVELKCKEALHPVDEAQLLSHLRLLNIPVGLLINFHVALLKDGIKRMVNNYIESAEKSF